ncbi:MAG: AMP-dependent synthetase/ligase [Micrococcales bacterium]|nr:AMP-dependent synthetase/ligase [Micrococcales bacterium]
MDQITIAPATDVDPTWNTWTLLERRLREDGDRTLIEVQRSPGVWSPVTTREFIDEAKAVALGLIALGVDPGDRVALMSRTRYEWTLFDYAIWAAGAVSVPIYETSSVDQIRWICSDSAVKAAVVETDSHRLLVDAARADIPGLTRVWQIESGDVEALKTVGRPIPVTQVDERLANVHLDSLATIIYTSGTTGRPKGTELDHAQFVRLAENTQFDFTETTLRHVICQPTARTLFFLPLAHVFARFIEVLTISSKTVIGHCPDTKTLIPSMESFRPTFLLAVPRVMEKVYNAAEQKAGTGAKLKLFRRAAKAAIVYSRALETPHGPSSSIKAQRALFDRLVYSKIRQSMGGKAEYVVSGGAPLGERLGHFFRGIGLTVLEGYGLTETTAPIVVNRPSRQKIGSVGIPFPGCSIAIAHDGEVLAKGVNVFTTYRNNPEATAEAFDEDGWFLTGDVGTLDDDGYLFITGRKKEIIVTAGGKNVVPALLEDRLRGHPLVSQCVVVGDAKPYVAALITLDAEMLPGWLKIHSLPEMDIEAARRNDQVQASIQRAVDRTNEAVSRAESIRRFSIIPGDFTELNGYLTPSLKVKRSMVLRDYGDVIEEMYSHHS